MTINSEQIQALKAAERIAEQLPAALEAWEKSNQGSVTLGWIHAANPVAVKSLLAERDADKALIAESVVLFETLSQRIAELEDRTLTVTFPEAATVGGQGYRKKAIWVLQEACFDAGITLVVGE